MCMPPRTLLRTPPPAPPPHKEDKATEPEREDEPEDDDMHPFLRMLANYRSAHPIYSEDDVINAASDIFTDEGWQ